jgi:hypothetical protein
LRVHILKSKKEDTMANRTDIADQINNLVAKMLTAGDVIIGVENNTDNGLVFEYYSDVAGEFHINVVKKNDYDDGKYAANHPVVNQNNFFISLDLIDGMTISEEVASNESAE